MANNPPASETQKWRYRSIFIGLAIALIAVNYWQAAINADEQRKIKVEALAAQDRIEAQYNVVRGKLDTVNQFVAHPPSTFDSKQVAAAVHAMAGLATTTEIPPTYGNLKARCLKLSKELAFFADERTEMEPIRTRQLKTMEEGTEAYRVWHESSSNLFRGQFLDRTLDIQKELAGHDWKDEKMDRILGNFQHSSYTSKNLTPDDIKEMAKALRKLADQIP